MKKIVLSALAAMSLFSLAWAAETMWIQRADNITMGLPLELADSVALSSDGKSVIFQANNAVSQTLSNSNIVKVTMGDAQNVVSVKYSGTDAAIVNPYAFEGVSVEKNGGDVIIRSTSSEELTYDLSGTTTSGSFKIYSDKKFILNLDNVSITNNDGAAINIQSGKKCTVNLVGTSSLTDASSYATVSGEDQKGCFFSEGQLVFTGEGTLNVTANYKHGVCSDDYIDIQSGSVKILKAANDGIRANDYFLMTGGSLTTTSTTGDGIDADAGYIKIDGGSINVSISVADTKAIKCDSIIEVNGGSVTLTVPAAQGKGFKTKQTMTVNGGTITANMTGAVAIVSNDPSYCTAFKTDVDFVMNDGVVTVTHTGAGGKGISADGNVKLAGGKLSIDVTGANGTYTNLSGVTDNYSSTCVSADGAINVTGGDITLGVKANSAKGFKSDGNTTISGGTINGTLTGSSVVVNYDPSHCTLIKCDGNYTQNGGTITATHSGVGGKGISVDGVATFNSGNVTITTTGSAATYTASSGTDTYSPICISVDGNLNLLGGTFNVKATGAGGKCIKSDQQIIMGTVDGASLDTIAPLEVTAETTGAQFGTSSGGANQPPGGRPGRPGSTTSTSSSTSPKVIKAMDSMTVNSGSFTIKSSSEGGEGIESKTTITINGGNFYFNTYDDCINAKTALYIKGGNLRCVATGNDAIDSNGAMQISGGLMLANGTREPEEGLDVDNASQLSITGGTVINQKGNMLNLTTTQAKVPTIKYSSSISAGTLITITDSSGNHLLSFKSPQAMSQGCYITLPQFKSGSSYKLYTGGSVSGGTVFNEVTVGGSFTGGTQVKSFTISSNLTSI